MLSLIPLTTAKTCLRSRYGLPLLRHSGNPRRKRAIVTIAHHASVTSPGISLLGNCVPH